MSSTNAPEPIKFGNCYSDFPELYDVLYSRYFKSIPTFINLIKNSTPSKGTILDLAAGTGEVTIPLLKLNYQVSSLDLEPGMLEQLKSKAKLAGLTNYQLITQDMRHLSGEAQYDTVCIRQAINYNLGLDELEQTLKHIHKILKPGGHLVFNAPNFRTDIKTYPDVENRYDFNSWHVFVIERNALEARLLIHDQEAIIWQDRVKPIHITDQNRFYMFAKPEFEACLDNAGFSKIEFYSSNLSPYNQHDKTLYGVATK